METIDFSQIMKDFKGNPIQTGDHEEPNATLGAICITALMTPDREAKPMEKIRRDELARKIFNAEDGCLEVSHEDIVLIKERVGENPMPIVVGQAFRMLDGPVKESPTE